VDHEQRLNEIGHRQVVFADELAHGGGSAPPARSFH
jgi:hypothetical protein